MKREAKIVWGPHGKLRFYSKGDGASGGVQAWEGKNLTHKIPVVAEGGVKCGQARVESETLAWKEIIVNSSNQK